MDYIQQVSSVKEKLLLLKEKDKEFRVFGAASHRYELFPPLAESRIAEFEASQNVKLPEDYRLFLTEIGNGGAGPDHGMTPFEVAVADTKPNRFFQWTNESEVEFSEETEQAAREWEDWTENRPGIVRINEQGCGIYTFLVVNGHSYGETWVDFFGSMKPLKNSFIEDYRIWLDSNLAKFSQ